MGDPRRLVIASVMAVAAFGIGGTLLAGPASALPTTEPVTVSSPAPQPLATTGPTAPASDDEDPQESRKKVKAGTVYDLDTGKWRAMVTGRNGRSAVSGSYDSEEQAQQAADEWANQINNGVMDGPGCDPPVVLC